MRTVTGGQLSDMAAAAVVHYLRVEVMNADGVFKDLTNLGGVDWVDKVTIDTEALDTQIGKATINLRREITGGVTSVAPLITASTLNVYTGGYAPLLDVGRQVRISVAVVLPGVTPGVGDWKELWLGRINNVQWGADPVVVECSDFGAWLMDTQIESVPPTWHTYGSSGGVALETVIQDIINDWPSGVLTPTLYTPASPGWMVHEFAQSRVMVFQAILTLAQQIGYDIRYRYDASDNYKLTLFAPARSKTVADATIGPAQYTDVTKLELAIDDIRNVAHVVYTLANGNMDTQTASDSGSISHFGRRFMETLESATANIDTAAEALAMAQAMVHDLAQPIAEQEITMLLFWPAQLGDLYTFTANGIHYDTDQKLAVVGVKHELSQGVGVTTLTCRGTVAGAYAQWLAMQNFSTDVGPGLIAVTASFTPAGVLVCSVNCESTVGSFKIAVDTSGYPTAATVRAATVHNGHAGDVTFTGPYTGTVYISVLAYGGANATGVESLKFDMKVTDVPARPAFAIEVIQLSSSKTSAAFTVTIHDPLGLATTVSVSTLWQGLTSLHNDTDSVAVPNTGVVRTYTIGVPCQYTAGLNAVFAGTGLVQLIANTDAQHATSYATWSASETNQNAALAMTIAIATNNSVSDQHAKASMIVSGPDNAASMKWLASTSSQPSAASVIAGGTSVSSGAPVFSVADLGVSLALGDTVYATAVYYNAAGTPFTNVQGSATRASLLATKTAVWNASVFNPALSQGPVNGLYIIAADGSIELNSGGLNTVLKTDAFVAQLLLPNGVTILSVSSTVRADAGTGGAVNLGVVRQTGNASTSLGGVNSTNIGWQTLTLTLGSEVTTGNSYYIGSTFGGSPTTTATTLAQSTVSITYTMPDTTKTL